MTHHNLPPEFDPFVDRSAVREDIHACLEQPWCGFVTLVGMGGVGKTRLATAVARERLHHYIDGVWLVELAEIVPETPAALAAAIAAVLGLPWREREDPVAQVTEHLQNKQMLLILDSFEHLIRGGVPLLLRIVQRCPEVHLLITSQEAFGLPAGRTFVLTGLDYPASDEDERPSSAVELFLARRAQQQWSEVSADDHRAVRQICRQVEGLPLAIELAASLCGEKTPLEIADKLRDGFDILAAPLRDVPARHRSLRAMLDPSWRRLPADLQHCLVRLAVFDGGFTTTAAQRMAQVEPEQISALHNRSWLMADVGIERYRLHPVVRAAVPILGSDDPFPPR